MSSIRPSRTAREYLSFSRNTPAGGSLDCVVSQITKPSGRDARPPVASRMISGALTFLPNSQASSISTPTAFLPPTVSPSAATTLSVAPVSRWVMVRKCGWTCIRSRNSSSCLTISAAGLNELSAISLVGARMMNSADRRQLRISAVSMIPAAMVDLEFFFGMHSMYSEIIRRPVV